MRIIIAGNGKVGNLLIRQLSAEGNDLTVIDVDEGVLAAGMERYDIMSVSGNCAALDTLHQAGVESADLLIAATNADEINLLCCLTAHGVNPNLHTIARIRNPEYSEQIYAMRDTFALSLSVNPERQAAVEIERLLNYPGFLKRDTFAKGRVEIFEIRVDGASKLCNVALSALPSVISAKILVCAALRDGTAVTPAGNYVLKEGDRIFVTAPSHQLAALLSSLGMITRRIHRVILAGGGRVSYYLAQQLLKSGVSVQIIEKKRDRCLWLAEELPRAQIICGDARDQSLLDSEGVGTCDALISLTDLDELNVIISLYASQRHVPQVITKLGRLGNSNILDDLPIGSIICPKELCCNTITRYVRAVDNQTGAAVAVHTIAEGQAEALEFHVDETTLHCGIPLKHLRIRPNVLIACISRRMQPDIPNGDSTFQVGDSLVVVTSGGVVLHQLNDIFEQ